jgi:3D (Asp-Asp-Asp) domain-containing protein
MRRRLAALAAFAVFALGTSLGSTAQAAPEDPLGDLIMSVVTGAIPGAPTALGWNVKATLYHAGAKGVGALDSLGCRVVAMRTLAVDRNLIPRRSVVFIAETVGLPMPDGTKHDGFWYASDTGGAIKGERIDMFTGSGAKSMKAMAALNLARMNAVKVGEFKGCPPA